MDLLHGGSQPRKSTQVLTNITKTRERNHNSPGNKSFLNRSSKCHISELRNNNARLARTLAKEKARTAELFRRFTSCNTVIMDQKMLLRSAFHAVKASMSKFNDTIDLMIQGTAVLSDLNKSILSYCPELEEPTPTLASNVNHDETIALTPSQLRILSTGNNNTVPSESVQSPSTPVSTVRHCTAQPMVKGQVISKPTISLQRLNVPTRHFATGMIQPERGVQFFPASNNGPSRLSDVYEETNEPVDHTSNTSPLTVSPAHRSYSSSSSYQPCTSKSLPPSHVVLERIIPEYECPSNELELHQLSEDDEQLTAVHFGSINFNNSPFKEVAVSPEKLSPSKSSSREKKDSNSPAISKSALTSGNSIESPGESSSEDEDLALRIVESKRSYLDRKRQEDSMEGTSWNYDEAGKFCKGPPRKRRSMKSVQGIVALHAKTAKQKAKDSLLRSRELRRKPSLEQGVTINPSEEETFRTSMSPKISSKSNNSASSMSLEDPLNDTVYSVQDMSFTCVSKDPSIPVQLAKATSENGEEIQESILKLVKTSEQPSLPERNVYVTQRTHGRKPPDNWGSQDLCSLYPMSSPSSKRIGSQVENNENSPPGHALSSDEMVQSMPIDLKDLPQLPSVVLERLPNNINFSSSLQLTDDRFGRFKLLKTKMSSKKDEEPTASTMLTGKTSFKTPLSPTATKKTNSGIKIESGDVQNEMQRKPRSNTGPTGKELKRSVKVQKSLEVPSTSTRSQCISSASSPTSPTSSNSTDDRMPESENRELRRRNLATSYKEVPCNRKMRRP